MITAIFSPVTSLDAGSEGQLPEGNGGALCLHHCPSNAASCHGLTIVITKETQVNEAFENVKSALRWQADRRDDQGPCVEIDAGARRAARDHQLRHQNNAGLSSWFRKREAPTPGEEGVGARLENSYKRELELWR